MPERIEFKLCALVYKCLKGSGPAYLADSLQRVTDVFVVNAGRHGDTSCDGATLGDRSFPVAAARAWDALPDFVTAAPKHRIILCCAEDLSVFTYGTF